MQMTMAENKTCFLVNWSVTGKRGRKHPPSKYEREEADPHARAMPTAQELAEDRDMACFLVMLACSGNANGSMEDGREMTEEFVYQSKAAKLMIPKCESDGSIEDSDGGKTTRIKERKEFSIMHSIRHKPTSIKIKLVDDGESVWRDSDAGVGETSGKYKCNKCKKVFNCHQALGGHRASHRKVKGCSSSSTMSKIVEKQVQGHVENEEEEIITEDGRLRIRHFSSQAVKTFCIKAKAGHECSVCHKFFQSGQALGGHKRCHWIGGKIPTESSFISMDAHHQGILNDRGELSLPDLNQTPPVAEEEDLEATYSITDLMESSRGHAHVDP
jgi:hypothetical protein